MTLNPPLLMEAVTGDTPITYHAQDFRGIISALAPIKGIILSSDLAVSQRGAGANMSVDVAAGRGFINGDAVANQGMYIVQNTAAYNVPISAANATNPRIDLIVATIHDKQADGGTTYGWTITAVAGTPAASPVAPSVPASSLLLAQVTVAANASSIATGNITDKRVLSGTGSIPAWEYSGTAPQSVPNASQTSYAPTLTTEQVGVTVAGNALLKIQTPGRYVAQFSVRYNSGGSSGERTVIIAVQDTTGALRRQVAQRIDTVNQAPLSVSGTFRLAAGETIGAYMYQASGASLSLLNTFNEAAFTGAWIGP